MLKLKGIKKSFEGKTVLDGIDLEVKRGEVVAIIGPSGTGKSTLLRCINLLEMPDEGKEQYDLRGQTSMVFQQYNLFANKTALENITEPLTRVKHLKKEEARRQGREILKVVGLTEKEKEYPSRMSGGQQQRVGIGRALATHPKVMLLDEPTSSLDPELVGEVLDVVRTLASKHITMLITTHEMDFARSVADRVLFLADGRIQEEGTPKQIFDFPKTERLKIFLSHYHS